MDKEWSKLQQLIKQEEKKEADAGALSKASKMLREAIKYCRENGLEAIAAVAIIDTVESKKGLRICYAGFTASASTLHLLKLADQLADCVNNDYIITDVKEIGRYPG